MGGLESVASDLDDERRGWVCIFVVVGFDTIFLHSQSFLYLESETTRKQAGGALAVVLSFTVRIVRLHGRLAHPLRCTSGVLSGEEPVGFALALVSGWTNIM
jgi:hypothetical protein